MLLLQPLFFFSTLHAALKSWQSEPQFSFLFDSRHLDAYFRFSLPVVGSEGSAIGLKHLIVVRQSNLSLVGPLIGITGSLLTLSLLKSHALVLGNDGLVVSDLAGMVLIFEHTAHAKDGLLLLSPVSLLISIGSSLLAMLTDLLVSPVPLVLSIESHSVVVHYKAR